MQFKGKYFCSEFALMRLIPHRSVGTESGLRSSEMESEFSFYFKISSNDWMARVISTKSQNIYVKDRPYLKVFDRECLEDQKCKEGLIPFPSNIQQLMVRSSH